MAKRCTRFSNIILFFFAFFAIRTRKVLEIIIVYIILGKFWEI